MDPISECSVDRMMLRDQALVRAVEGGSPSEALLLDKVSAFLAHQLRRGWTDLERVEIVGAKLFASARPEVWRAIRAAAAAAAPALADDFARYADSRRTEPTGGDQGGPESAAPRAAAWVSKANLDRFLAKIEEGRTMEIEEEIVAADDAYRRVLTDEATISRYLSFLAPILGRLNRGDVADRPVRARLMHRLARSFVTWAPYQEHGWRFLGEAYELEGAYVEEERIAWEKLRRSRSAESWTYLLDFLVGFEDRRDEWVRLSQIPIEEGIATRRIVEHRLRAILYARDFTDLAAARDLAGRLLRLAADGDAKAKQHAVNHFMNFHILDRQQGGDIGETARRYAHDLLRVPRVLKDLRYFSARFSGGAYLAETVLAEGLARDPLDGALQDDLLLARLFAEGAVLDRALADGVRLLDGGDVRLETRLFLAYGLVKRGLDGDVEQAMGLLKRNMDAFPGDNGSRVAFAALKAGKFEEVRCHVVSRGEAVNPDGIKGVGFKHAGTRRRLMADSAPTLFPLPRDLHRMTTLTRYAALLMDEPDPARRNEYVAALKRVRDASVRADDAGAYAQLLIARFDDDFTSEQELPHFAARFEYALKRGDRETLARIGRDHPKLAALSMLARAMFGDPAAAADVRHYLSHSPAGGRYDTALHATLSALAANDDRVVRGDVVNLVEWLNRLDVARVVRNGNESVFKIDIAA